MKHLALIALGLLTVAATFTAQTGEANAVVCARGVYRAGCAGPHGAVGVRRAPVCHYIFVNGVRVRRCH